MELSAYDQYLQVDPIKGAAITRLSLKSATDEKVLISPQDDYHYESALLFPFPNRLAKGQYNFGGTSYAFPLNDFGRPNALHGMLHDQHFEVIEEGEALMKLRHHYKGDLPYYPFPFRFEITYKLLPAQLDVSVVVTNSGNTPLPCGFGWHPYFNLGQKATTKMWLKDVECIEVDENLIPTGKATPYKTFEEPAELCDIKLDSCFRFKDEAEHRNTMLLFADGSQLEIYQDRNHPYVQVFTPNDGKTIAIEPMTCSINALNTQKGLTQVRPSDDWSLNFGIRLIGT